MIGDYITPILIAVLGTVNIVYQSNSKKHIDQQRNVEEERSNTTGEWQGLYKATAQERDEVKAEYKQTRDALDQLKEELAKIKLDIYTMRQDFYKKEEGYKITIEKLEEENDDLKEEVAILSQENAELKALQGVSE